MTKTYSCDVCNYCTIRKNNYEKHLVTRKHLMSVQSNERMPINQCITQYCCEHCGNVYSDNSGLWRHKKKCQKSSQIESLLIELIKSNNELQNRIVNTQVTSNVNCNNKTFNLNVYLNETCKNAMNMSEFVNSIKMNLDDLEHTGRKGYVEGISTIILRNLKDIEDKMRPIHCSDNKREILYIKDNDKWEKDCTDKLIMTKAINNIAYQNMKQIQYWKEKNPDCTSSQSTKNDLYLQIVNNSMNGFTKEEEIKNNNKIISYVAKEVMIDKLTL